MEKHQIMELGININPGLTQEEMIRMAKLASRLGLTQVFLPAGEYSQDFLAEIEFASSPAVVVPHPQEKITNVLTTADLELVGEVQASDGNSSSAGLTLDVNIFIGRTLNEATARAERDARFSIAELRASGIFGTFEQAQELIVQLAGCGVTRLIATIPYELDVADVLAQVRALVVGPTVKLSKA